MNVVNGAKSVIHFWNTWPTSFTANTLLQLVSWCAMFTSKVTKHFSVLQVSWGEHPELHHLLERWPGLQRPHTQTQAGHTNAQSHIQFVLYGDINGCINCSPFNVSVTLRPDLIEFHKLTRSNATHNLQQAFNTAEQHLGLTKLLDPEGERVNK